MLTPFVVFRPLGGTNEKTKKQYETKQNVRDQALANFVAGLRNASSSAPANLPKPVALMGDLNCARTPLDIYTTQGKADAAGFTEEERESFERRILGGGARSAGVASSVTRILLYMAQFLSHLPVITSQACFKASGNP